MTDDRHQTTDLRALAEAAMPGPWVACGHNRGGCTCGFIYSQPADAPVATATIGVWGDEWPSLRPVGGSIEGRFEAYMEMMAYGEVPEERGKANAAFIAAANPTVVLGMLDEIDRLRERVAALEVNP